MGITANELIQKEIEQRERMQFNVNWWYQRQYPAGQTGPLLTQENAKGIDRDEKLVRNGEAFLEKRRNQDTPVIVTRYDGGGSLYETILPGTLS